jgi:GNAT superfamily N-acetyltransferase
VIIVRAARVDDARAIAAVDVASWRAAYRDLMPAAYLDALSVEEKTARWSSSLAREAPRRKQTLVAEDDGAVIGYATVGPDGESGSGLLYLMYVAPDQWRRGVGAALMAHVCETLRRDGFRSGVLWVLERNDRARGFYEAQGWSADGASQINDYGRTKLSALRYTLAL